MKESKKQYYSNYFKNNLKNMKSTWKGMESIIYLKTSKSESGKRTVNCKGEFLINPVEIANCFNNFFLFY